MTDCDWNDTFLAIFFLGIVPLVLQVLTGLGHVSLGYHILTFYIYSACIISFGIYITIKRQIGFRTI